METYLCENCGNVHDGSYGSGRFCSLSCRKSYIAKHVKHRGANQQGKHKHAPYGTWKCAYCGLIFDTRAQLQKHKRAEHPILKGHSWNYGLTKSTDCRVAKYVDVCKSRNHYSSASKGRKMSIESRLKISSSMKSFLAKHPDQVPYLRNHSSKESYPEQYFRTAFINERFPNFVQEKHVKSYFLDFAFESQKLYVEIDGEQHYTDKRIVEHDKIRQTILTSFGWKCVCRIRWSKFQKLTEAQKHQFLIGLKNKIVNF